MTSVLTVPPQYADTMQFAPNVPRRMARTPYSGALTVTRLRQRPLFTISADFDTFVDTKGMPDLLYEFWNETLNGGTAAFILPSWQAEAYLTSNFSANGTALEVNHTHRFFANKDLGTPYCALVDIDSTEEDLGSNQGDWACIVSLDADTITIPANRITNAYTANHIVHVGYRVVFANDELPWVPVVQHVQRFRRISFVEALPRGVLTI